MKIKFAFNKYNSKPTNIYIKQVKLERVILKFTHA